MSILLALCTLFATITASALPLTFHLDKRPITLKLPSAREVGTHHPARDYDHEILAHSLNLFERCLRGIRTETHPTLTVPNWQALLGLSTRLRQHERAEDESAFLRFERLDMRDEASFLTSLFDAFRTYLPAPIDARLLARTAVLGLNAGVNKEFIAWLSLELGDLPASALRPVREAGVLRVHQPAPRPSAECASEFGANVVAFRPRPSN